MLFSKICLKTTPVLPTVCVLQCHSDAQSAGQADGEHQFQILLGLDVCISSVRLISLARQRNKFPSALLSAINYQSVRQNSDVAVAVRTK